jgi:hypothetical protein
VASKSCIRLPALKSVFALIGVDAPTLPCRPGRGLLAKPAHKVVALMLAALLLQACSDSVHESESSPVITPEGLVLLTPDPHISYPLQATISLTSDQVMNDVPVSLFVVENTDDPEVEPRSIPLGTVTIEQVDAGTNDYALNVIVPASVEFAGSYFLVASLDELDEWRSAVVQENLVEAEMTFAEPVEPNILLEEFAIDRSALIISVDEYVAPFEGAVYQADAGGTVTLGADGLALGESVVIEAFATLRINRSDNGTSLVLPLYLWNTLEERYTYAYGVDPASDLPPGTEWLPLGEFTPLLVEETGSVELLNDVRRDSEHIGFYFPGKLGSELEKALRYPCVGDCVNLPTDPPPDLTLEAIAELQAFLSDLPFSGEPGDESAGMAVLGFDICMEIRAQDAMQSDSSLEDNKACSPLDIYLPPLPGDPPPFYDIGGYTPAYPATALPMNTGGEFKTQNSNGYFAFNLDVGASASADERGFIGNVHAIIPVEVFGNDYDLLGVGVRAQLVPEYYNRSSSDESGMNYEIRFLNQVIDIEPSIRPLVTFDLISSGLLPIEALSYSKKLGNDDEDLLEKQVSIGPIPFVVTATVATNFGVDYSVGYADDAPWVWDSGNETIALGATIALYANLEAGLAVGLGTIAFQAGVEGVLTLLDDREVYYIGTIIEVIDDGSDSKNVEFIITPQQRLSNIFTGPQGKLNLFVKYTTIVRKTCRVGRIKYSCLRVGDKKRTLNIYTSPALFQLEWTKEYPFADLDVVIVDGYSPAYFRPLPE